MLTDSNFEQSALDCDDTKELFLFIDFSENSLICDISGDYNMIWNSPVFKLKLKRYLEISKSSHLKLVFKDYLTYPHYKKIIQIFSQDSKNRGYGFEVSEKVSNHIELRELYINERANVGIAIKQQL